MRSNITLMGQRLRIGVAAIVIGAVLAPAARGANEPDPAALKKRAERATIRTVKKKLPQDRTPGLAASQERVKVKVTSCKQRMAGRRLVAFRCAWNAHGELRGRVLLRCKGKAKVRVGARKARGVKCTNLEELQAPLLAEPHETSFGYFEDFSTTPDLFDELTAGGANLMREGITWKVLQPDPALRPPDWDWKATDEVYRQALATGVRPVFTFRNAPCWAAVAPCVEGAPNPPDPSHYPDYAAAAAEIVKRYPELAAIEIWFEPNSAKFWGAPADPAGFSSLVGQAAAAVHATGIGVPVWTGGLAPGAADPDKIVFDSFLSQALDAGGIQAADAIAFHAVTEVPFKPGDDPTQGYLGRLRIQAQSLKTALAAHGVAKPLVFTQLSYSSAPGEYTEDQQAEALVSSYEVLRRIADVPAVIVAKLLDNGDGSKVQGFGVLRPDRSPKPAYCQLAAARGAPPPAGC